MGNQANKLMASFYPEFLLPNSSLSNQGKIIGPTLVPPIGLPIQLTKELTPRPSFL